MKLFVEILIFVLVLPSVMMAEDPLLVDFQSERHRTEWNWVEYRITLKNIAPKAVVNPVVRYFAENTNIQYCEKNANDVGCRDLKMGVYNVDSMLAMSVDYISNSFQAKSQITSVGKYTIVDIKTIGLLNPSESLTVNFRLYRKDWNAWDCSRDFSYQKNAVVKEKNYFIAIYDDDDNILWGYNPLDGENRTGSIVWNSRDKFQVIEKFNDSGDKVIPNGRFWILKDSVFTSVEKRLLREKGVNVYDVSTYQGLTLLFCRNSTSISTKLLKQLLSGFYNAFSADDVTPLSLVLDTDDFYEKKNVCNNSGRCEETVEEKISHKMDVVCWPDVGIFKCKDIVKSCGGSDALIDRSVVIATVPRDSVSCLSKNQNVRGLNTEKRGVPFDVCTDGRTYAEEDINGFNRSIYGKMRLLDLQNSQGWQNALEENIKTTSWLSNEYYTGEGITVGVYDQGMDFRHPAFQEYDVEMKKYVPRLSSWYNKKNRNNDSAYVAGKFTHGTGVAGIIGGNGSGIPKSLFRGIAPKVKFYSFDMVWNSQYGHVTNHSHGLTEDDKMLCFDCDDRVLYYGEKVRTVDEYIFRNWKLFTENGDYLTKAIVVAAGNNGQIDRHTGKPQTGLMVGFYSVLSSFKNTITVGNMDANVNFVPNYSSLGPTWDGRIKPDLMAHGNSDSFISTTVVGMGRFAGGSYDFMCGTSASAPVVTGVAALMYQRFRQKTGMPLENLSMRNSTTKALLIHSAIDMAGNRVVRDVVKTMGKSEIVQYGKGPDFITGWGSVDAKGALDLIEGYNDLTQKFDRFREFEIYNGMKKRWTFNIPAGAGIKKARVTLVWDDAVPSIEDVSVSHFKDSKLVNDLDMYLLSPSGKPYYPWKLDPLPTIAIDSTGRLLGDIGLLSRTSGLEMITLDDCQKLAYKACRDSSNFRSCFDHLNNVEVVDVEGDSEDGLIEAGEWQIVVEGYKVKVGNSLDGFAQVASIVCDFKLEEPMCHENVHPYQKNSLSTCVYELGDNFENYVTFDNRTNVALNDWIYLYDSADQLIGRYTGSELAGKTVTVKTKTLKIVLESNGGDQQGWGYAIEKQEYLPYDVLAPLIQDSWRKKR